MPAHDYWSRMGLFPYDTRYRALPPPEENIFDAPTMQICINVKWAAHLDGLLERLLWLDAWAGDIDDKTRAVGEVTKLLVAMMRRDECEDEMDVRQSSEDCKVLEKFDGETWLPFADFNGCIEDGADGADGAPGTPGAPGADGAPGSGGNIYPPMPTAAQQDALCNAATYIVAQVRGLIADVYADLATIDPGDVLNSLLGQNGWNFTSLYDLIAFQTGSLENEMANLALYDAAAPDLICELISLELDKDAFTDFIDTTYTNPLHDMLMHAIQAAAAEGKYALWAAYGSTLTTADCDSCNIPGFLIYGNVGTTTVDRVGNVYTITGGFIGGGGAAYLYVGASVDGTAVSTTMTYTSLVVSGNNIADDWGDASSSFVTDPPVSAPPPNVRYAGGLTTAATIASIQIVIETTMPMQGLVQGT